MNNISNLKSQISNHQDTICATATAPGGALGIIRVSGPDAFPIVSTLCPVVGEASKLCASLVVGEASKLCKPSVHYTHLVAPAATPGGTNEAIDDVIVTIFRAPHSYTGDDSVEISCHGSHYILQRVLDLLCQQGCRMAHPGEFTMRAYLNGKMDLSQAEAVADLIASSNKATHDIAMSQLRGHFSSELARLRNQLLRITSLLELELDFSDHEDLEFADRTELLSLAQEIDSRVMRLARSFETGQALKQGIPVAIVGKTNVGKSTLLNQLVGDDRAIVSDIHGTTRDTIEDTIDINGITFRFIDTAGIRQTTDEVEQIGIRRTYAAINKARIVLWLIDKVPTQDEIADIISLTGGASPLQARPSDSVPVRSLIPVWNKADIIPPCSVCCDLIAAPIPISAKTGQSLDTLKATIYAAADIPSITSSDVVVTSIRHYDALCRAHSHLQRVISGLQAQLSGDLLSEDLRQVLDSLSEITGGQITPQETLKSIFSNFCIGK